MSQDNIDELLTMSENVDEELKQEIASLINSYKVKEKESVRLKKQNEFFIKQWDKRNIIAHERDAKKDKMLKQQSKMAAMGEMMDAVAHQWKQPLNSISMMSDMLKDDFERGLVDQKYVEELTSTTNYQIEHMINTLNEFRTFFRPSTESSHPFYLIECIQSVQVLMKDELISHNVEVRLDIEEDLTLDGLKNDFKHLFLNLISNSVDAFEEAETERKEILIKAYAEGSNIYVEFEDNAGGIAEEVMDDLFKPNVTTKKEGKGTGIGLYMTLQIINKHHGKINVHNSEVGALFTITLQR